MRRLSTAVFGFLAISPALVGSCKDDSDGGGDSGTGSSTDATAGSEADSGVDGSTGGEPELVPCDPRADACEAGRVCTGLAQSGFYCRPGCSSMAMEGTECSEGGVCLPASPLSTVLGCVPLSTCDVTTGDGCDVPGGESCAVVDLEPVRTSCIPAGPGANGDECDPTGPNPCDVALGCLGSDLEDDEPGRCTPWCLPGGALPQDCALCVELVPELGSCAECSILDDACPAGSQCQPVNELLGGVCVPFGPAGEDEPCNPIDPASACDQGLLCLEVQRDVYACVPTCDPMAPMCDDPEKTCVDIGNVVPGALAGELGVCVAAEVVFCDPAMPACAPMQICLEVMAGLGVCADPCDPQDGAGACDGNYACVPELDGAVNSVPLVFGNGACGLGCTGDVDCAGGTCLLVDGLAQPGVCGATCDPAAPMCAAMQTCVATPGDPMVGACIEGGAACDPTMPESCGALLTACVALAGDTVGACMPGCWVQDPMACGGMAIECLGRTDMAWHSGACLGQSTPCDLVAQDCGAGSSCTIVGGTGLGGVAYVCGQAGAVPEGGDCSMADCAEGLGCLADVCVSFCDLAAPACAQGTCTDIGATFYLPAGSVGACL